MSERHALTVRLPAELHVALEDAVHADAQSVDRIVEAALVAHLRGLKRMRDLLEAFADVEARETSP